MKFQTIVTMVLIAKTIVKEKNVGKSCWNKVEKLTFRMLMPHPDHLRQII